MKLINIPTSIKKEFLYRTLLLIAELNQSIEKGFPILAGNELAYMNELADIDDIGLRHKVMLEAFARALTE